ncbi:thermonuclease family protein [Pseudobacillus wudalianchiensis]|uniref:Thermonuclease n=1 Tax=Pseudobacillus wudalianchiensis TaxID=1743143 RepID=A0A1B9AIQ2_9BACI|nr:thermonuclease family protein [Bacillus wudalianchiensis]OCA83722.1 thermonuclease [Bacillus wudalianchiensis]
MSRFILILCLAILFIMSGCAAGQQPADTSKQSPESTEDVQKQEHSSLEAYKGETESKNRLTGTVVYVVDGDTFDVKLSNGKKERVRMTLVDTPETKHPRLGVQPFGPEASAFTKKLLTGQDVALEMDVQERDRYGRVLAYVWLDGQLVNEQLIAKGLARVAIFPPNTKYVDRFEQVQQKAREQRLGIWSVEDYVTDRGYNAEPSKKEESASPAGDCQIKGNISSSGERIYHVPGNQSYEITKPEQMFCTKEEAEAAGFRAAKR